MTIYELIKRQKEECINPDDSIAEQIRKSLGMRSREEAILDTRAMGFSNWLLNNFITCEDRIHWINREGEQKK